MFSEQFDLSWGQHQLQQNVIYEVRPREPGSRQVPNRGPYLLGKYQAGGSVVLGSSVGYAMGPRSLMPLSASSEMGMIVM